MLSNASNFSRVQVLSMNKSKIKETAFSLNGSLSKNSGFPYSQRYLLSLEIIEFKIFCHKSCPHLAMPFVFCYSCVLCSNVFFTLYNFFGF